MNTVNATKSLITADTGIEVHSEVARIADDLMSGDFGTKFSFKLDKINPGGVVMLVDGTPKYCIFPYKHYFGFSDYGITGVYTDYLDEIYL